MSLYDVQMMIGLDLTIRLEAPNAETAQAIAEYLYREYGHRPFRDHGEELIDSYVEPVEGDLPFPNKPEAGQ